MARHRGPDADGAWALGWDRPASLASLADGSARGGASVALGFVRLSILDLGPTGSQPMVEGDRAAIAFNGEIYNFVELREELRSRGWTFASTGDSEVLLKGWLEWREDVFARLNGMWAVAIYDAAIDGVVLSRDRFGEKPLFWTPWSGGIAFASEVKQLRAFPGRHPAARPGPRGRVHHDGQALPRRVIVVRWDPPARTGQQPRRRPVRIEGAPLLGPARNGRGGRAVARS